MDNKDLKSYQSQCGEDIYYSNFYWTLIVVYYIFDPIARFKTYSLDSKFSFYGMSYYTLGYFIGPVALRLK